MPVSIREFKTHLSRYITQARSGRTVEISSHRKLVARLTGIPDTSERGIQSLLATGAADWSGSKPRGASIQLVSSDRSVSEIVLEDRG